MKTPLANFKVSLLTIFSFVLFINVCSAESASNKTYYLDENSPYFVNTETWDELPGGGDTIYISSTRTKALRFQNLSGAEKKPIVVINTGGQVQIDSPTAWGGITFENCKYIKITGTGHPGFKYGFTLSANTCGLAFSELSSDCEAEFIKISHEGFYGIMAKKNYDGNPPSPVPVFSNLIIHDCFIENVTEGMYLGETTTPGMEFKHVKIYNNVVRNTGRESIQIANMVDDVEIYNNTLLNAGQDDELYQNNILQIGDNSVANIYNNILIGAPKAGIITMGMGNNIFSNNYICSCKGMFIDNRKISNEKLPIVVSGNYFVNNTYEEIINNMNEINNIVVNNNSYNTNIYFFSNNSGTDNNLVFANNSKKELDTIAFVSPEGNNYALAEGTPEFYKNMGAPGGEEYFEVEEDSDELVMPSEQIVLSSEMIVEEAFAPGGSIYSPNYLVDEQDFTPENELHPVSLSWKPYWNMNYGPYHVYIDLKDVYTITTIALHDMNSTDNLVISVGEPGNWQPLFTEPCDKYKTWKEHTTNVKTRYIRISMYDSPYAAVNEIILYGYKVSDSVSEKSASLNTNISSSSLKIENDTPQEIKLIQNPIRDNLRFSIPTDLTSNFNIEVYDISGKKVMAKNYSNNLPSQELNISIAEYNMKNGMYIVKYSDFNGQQKTFKVVKTS